MSSALPYADMPGAAELLAVIADEERGEAERQGARARLAALHPLEHLRRVEAVYREFPNPGETPFESALKTVPEAVDYLNTEDARTNLEAAQRQQIAEELEVVRASEVSPKKLRWLWRGRVALGKLSILEGDPGLGKSTLLDDIVARKTRGHSMPGEVKGSEPGVAVILSAEDDAEDTTVPRLQAAGADLSRVFIVGATREKGTRRPVVLPEDVLRVEHLVRQYGAVLVIVDPIMAYLTGKADSFRDHDVRRALLPLQELAQRTGCALVACRHLKKGDSAKAIHKGGGSIGMGGAARSVLLVAEDPDDPTRRVLASVKCNVGPRPDSLVFRLVPWSGDPDYARIEWEGTTTRTADELVAPAAQGDGAGSETARFILDTLGVGERLAADLYREAETAGIALPTLKRAKARLGVVSFQKGGRGRWIWKLPAASGDQASSVETVIPCESLIPRERESQTGTLGTEDQGITESHRSQGPK